MCLCLKYQILDYLVSFLYFGGCHCFLIVFCMYLKLPLLNFSTIEEEIFVGQEDDPELLDDFDFEQNEATAIKDKDVYKQKLKRRASQYKVHFIISQVNAIWFTFLFTYFKVYIHYVI